MSIRTFVLIAAFTVAAQAQDRSAGQRSFESRCAICHGGDGHGTDRAPAIYNRTAARDNQSIATVVRNGLPGGMPAMQIPDAELADLTAYLRTLQPAVPPGGRVFQRPEVRETITLTDGKTLSGVVVANGLEDHQIRTDDGKIHLLRRVGDRFREVTSTVDWPTFHGDMSGNRYTTMTQITKDNVKNLGARWIYTIRNAQGLQDTPQVVGGIMYVTNVNTCIALDAGSGRQLWQWSRPTTPGVRGAGSNRGVAVSGDRLFIVTDNAHIVALNRFTGAEVWDTEMADWHQNYGATGAPLAVGNLVIGGITGGEAGTRGFLAAFDQSTGKEMWRFWTVPKAGEPGSETWQGKDIEHGGGPTWITGTYDAQLDTLYWPTGNPAKEYNGDDRKGDNLYTDCLLALDPKTGKLKWYYQFTPHDLADWDATEIPVLVDANFQGQPRKLLLHADRNGFFYVFDRTNGKLLLAKQFLRELTWASGIGADGRPILNPNQEPTAAGTRVCPSQDGATNFYSPSYIPATGLFYFQTFEKCSIYTKRDIGDWVPGQDYLGGVQRVAPGGKEEHILRAMDINTGTIKWELTETAGANGWGGTISTATGLVFFGEEGGAFAAADASTGKLLWNFQTNQGWKASPMAYMFDGKEYLAVIASGNVIAFGLGE
jgi:alcohol dehydrogenase (cytochrome c)